MNEIRPRAKSALERELQLHHEKSLDLEEAPHGSRLYQMFGLIEKEFEALYTENMALRARIAQLTAANPDEPTTSSSASTANNFGGPNFLLPASSQKSRKGIQMGQKLRTALRGPPVFRDGSKFRLIRQFEGHRDGIWHVAADLARNICATASADQTCKIWSLDSNGTCLATYLGHFGSVNCVVFQENQELVASASGDESTHIWKYSGATNSGDGNSEGEDEDVENAGQKIRSPILRLTGHRGPVSCCEWLENGQKIVTASWDRTANICDVEKGEVVSILSGHESEVNHCSAHPDQRLVATSSKDTTFRLWDFREQIQSVAVFQGHQESVTSVAFTNDFRIISSSDDASVKIWDLRNMRSSLASIRLSSAANRVAVSKQNGIIAIPMDNRHVRIYDLNGNRLPRMPNRRCHTRMVSCCSWLDENSSPNLLTVGFDRTLAAWKVNIGGS
ncbi:unnamed protein product [Caenorhabditis angaria]|uniref:WD repeat-containing protein 37 n=1 Tax=Caenorhabditis angaria TaxID=860376 RepID=A0A9P1IFM8_9PELO|nr:unnamed protein product [Caenorhabditis angaria]